MNNKTKQNKLSPALKAIELEIARAIKERESNFKRSFEKLFRLKAKRLQILVAES